MQTLSLNDLEIIGEVFHVKGTLEVEQAWEEVIKDGSLERICRFADFTKIGGIVGIWGQDAETYIIGAAYNGAPTDGLIVTIPDHNYMVFTTTGKMHSAIEQAYNLAAEYHGDTDHLASIIEVYSQPTVNSENYEFTLLVPML